MDVNITNVDGESLRKAVGNGVVLVTGMPGSGKDFVANTVLSKIGEVNLLSSLAENKSGKWDVSFDSLRQTVTDRTVFYVGSSDNLREVKTELRTLYPNRPIFVVWVSPSPTIFRRSNELRLGRKDGDVPPSWGKIWKKRSVMSDHAIVKLDEHELLFVARMLDAVEVLVFHNAIHGDVSSVTEAWHMWRTDDASTPLFEVYKVFSSADYSAVDVLFLMGVTRVLLVVKIHRDHSAFSVHYMSDAKVEDGSFGEGKVLMDSVASLDNLRTKVIRLAEKRLASFLAIINASGGHKSIKELIVKS